MSTIENISAASGGPTVSTMTATATNSTPLTSSTVGTVNASVSPAAYSFASAPKAVPAIGGSAPTGGQRSKYRSTASANGGSAVLNGAVIDLKYSANLMFDKRVVRGNTYATQPAIRSFLPPASSLLSTKSKYSADNSGSGALSNTAKRSRQLGRSELDRANIDANKKQLGSSGGGGGLDDESTQTEDYLEELVDQIFEQDAAAQTDSALFEEVALPPLFVAKPKGEDKQTQIAVGDLFDFDKEVEHILEVLIGKCVDQSLTEVLEEEELRVLRSERQRFEDQRNAFIAQMQRREAEELRRFQEKERRLAEEKERQQREDEASKKRSAAQLAKAALHNLQQEILKKAEEQGLLYDPLRKQIEEIFLPKLVEQTHIKIKEIGIARQCVEHIAAAAVKRLESLVQIKATRDAQISENNLQEEIRKDDERLAKIEADSRMKADAEKKEHEERVLAEKVRMERSVAATQNNQTETDKTKEAKDGAEDGQEKEDEDNDEEQEEDENDNEDGEEEDENM